MQFARTRELDKVILTCKEAVSGYFTQYGFEVVYRDKDRLDLCLDIAPAIREALEEPLPVPVVYAAVHCPPK